MELETLKKYDRINELVMLLNYYRDQYYNNAKSEISDKEYDDLYDELVRLEKETGHILNNSPTQSVGYIVKSSLQKVTHNHPMLSLDKTKDIKEVCKFLNNKKAVVMAKMDGLTCSLKYVKGKLVSAETRGDGFIGEDILHNIEVMKSVPKDIFTFEDELIIDGEIISTYRNFNKVNISLPEEQQYKHIRNYASGSIRLLNNEESEKRGLTFIAWKFVKGSYQDSFIERWKELVNLGFTTVPIVTVSFISEESISNAVEAIKDWAKEEDYPIDGCVIGFDDITYGESLGKTAHHFKDQIAYKFYDESYPSKLKYVDWTMGKTGTLTPTAVFEPVNIDGTTVERASLHNISIIKTLGLTNGCSVYVVKKNQIIPQIDSCDTDGEGDIEIPEVCPICGARTIIRRDYDSEVLYCSNPNCEGKLLARFVNFVGRKATNIVGLSEANLEKFISWGWLKTFKDLYHLDKYSEELSNVDGFGKKSVTKLMESINTSRKIKLENYINAIGITGIGSQNAKTISEYFEGDFNKFKEALENNFDFSSLEGFGTIMNSSIQEWYKEDKLCENLSEEFEFIKEEKNSDNSLEGLRFCITGTFKENRETIKEKLISKGAIFVSSVSSKLNVLFAGESAGSKLDKAKELGIKIVNEEELYSNYID